MSGDWVDLLELGVAGFAVTLYGLKKKDELREGFREGVKSYDGEANYSHDGYVPSAEEIGRVLGEKATDYCMPDP